MHRLTLFFFLSLFFFPVFPCSDCEVFPKNHPAPFSKVLTFYRKEPFSLEAYYNNPKELPYPDPTIGTIKCLFILSGRRQKFALNPKSNTLVRKHTTFTARWVTVIKVHCLFYQTIMRTS